MRVLLAQLDPAPGDVKANLDAIAEALDAHPEAELAVFPELFLGGYDLDCAAGRALAADDPALGRLRRLARGASTAIVAGFAERLPDGGLANSAACIDADGRWAGTYRKVQLFGREAEVFTAGEELVLVELAGRWVGPLVCFDIEFPEPARALARAGAELLVSIAANMDPYEPDHALALKARALDNRLPHVYVNRVGAEGGLEFVGGSAAVGPDAHPLLAFGADPGLGIAEVGLDARPAAAVDYLRLARPELPVKVLNPITQGGTR
jgi:predicted amidohydrolase